MKKLLLLFLALTTTYLAAANIAEETAVSPYNDENPLGENVIDEVVVTATRTPLPLKNTPVITRIIHSLDMERQGIATLEDLLARELAGVEFHQAGYGPTVSFQGLDARYVLFLIDGERISGETYGNIDYSRIPLSAIEQVEIIRGASSVLYGSNAMGAVVNIITKMPKKRIEVSGSFRYGTPFQNNDDETLGSKAPESHIGKYRDKIDLPNTKTDLSVGFNTGKFRSLTTASFRTVDGYKLRGRSDEVRHYDELTKMRPKIEMDMTTMPPTPIIAFDESGIPIFTPSTIVSDTTISVAPDKRGMGISGWRDWYIGQKMDYTFNDKFRVEVSGNYFNRERYDFHKSMMDDNPISGYIDSDDTLKYQSYEGYNIRMLMEHSPNSRNKIYLSYMRDEYFRYEKDFFGNKDPKQRHTYNIPRLLWTIEVGKSHRLTSGLEMINEQLRFDLNSNKDRYDNVKSLNTGAIYVQDEMFTGRKISFVVGLRADWNNQFGFRATPKISAKYSFGNFSLRGNYSSGYRSASLKEMYMELDLPIASSPKILGNSDLKPESNHYLSMSLDYNRSWINLSATINKSFFRNKIDVVREVDPSGGDQQILRYTNIDRSELGSIELIGRFKVVSSLFLNVNYNYTYQSNDAPEGATQYIFPSPHTARMSVDYSVMAGRTRFGFNVNVQYVGAKTYEDFMSYISLPDALVAFIKNPTYPIPGNVMASMKDTKYFTGSYRAHMKGYAICNASMNIQFPKYIGLTVGVDNIFDYQPNVVSFNAGINPGTNGFIKLFFDF